MADQSSQRNNIMICFVPPQKR